MSWYEDEERARYRARSKRASNVQSSREALVAEYERLGFTVIWNRSAGYDPFIYMPGTDPKTATRRIRLQDRTVRREAKAPEVGWFKIGQPIAHKITLDALRRM